MENRRQTKKVFNRALAKQTPEVARLSGINVVIATVVSFNAGSRTSQVRIRTTGQVINNAKVSKQISALLPGEEVVVVSNDSNFVGRNYIVASFGGNFGNTTNTMDGT